MTLLLLLNVIMHSDELRSLSELRWKARIVLCKSDSALLDKLHDATLSEKERINERDIVYFIICGDRLISNYGGVLSSALQGEVQARLKKEAVVLIGKDGEMKGAHSSLRWTEIFAAIDAMPMRQREKRHR